MVRKISFLTSQLLRGNLAPFMNRRSEERIQAKNPFPVRMIRTQSCCSFTAEILDLSSRGLCFEVQGKKLKVGDHIQVVFRTIFGQSFIYEGQVLAQHISYPGASEDLKDGVFRFSILLNLDIEARLLSLLKIQLESDDTHTTAHSLVDAAHSTKPEPQQKDNLLRSA